MNAQASNTEHRHLLRPPRITRLVPHGHSLRFATRSALNAQSAAAVMGIEAKVDPRIIEQRNDEKNLQVIERVRVFWADVTKRAEQHGPHCIVTHGGVLGALLWLHEVTDETHPNHRFDHNTWAPPSGAWSAHRATGTSSWRWKLDYIPRLNKHNLF